MTQDKHPDSPAAVAVALRQINAWRRGGKGPMPEPKHIGQTIDRAALLIEAQQIPANPTDRQLKAFARHIARLQGQLAKARREAKPKKGDNNPRSNGD